LLEGRYRILKKQQVYSEVASLIQREDELSSDDLSPNTLAVFPLIYQGINPDYVPLSRGFSEMVSIDLAKVNQLTVLERIRIQAVLDELRFSRSDFVDQSTAPRSGKLLRAGTIVSGDYDITEDKKFMINLGSWDSRTSERKAWVNKSGDLNDFFILQKEVVFAFLERNGIDLTQIEKESIAYIPTQNLESFLAFSRGLLHEDAGNFKEAESFYRRAADLDPSFGAAADKLQVTQAIEKTSDKDGIVSTLREENPVVTNQEIDLSGSRTESLSNNINAGFTEGIDSRKPAQEESNLRENLSPLPPPPPPPTGKVR
jgi:tetratricopeptide (TPR) repeat protein